MIEARVATALGGAGYDGITIATTRVAPPAPGEVLVQITAASLNYRDIAAAKGLLPGLTREPDYIPLSCGAGAVIAIGDGVTRVAVGDRVTPLFAQGWISGDRSAMTATHLGGSVNGVARTHALFPDYGLSIVPDEIGDLEAATLPCAGITAWNALFGARPLASGETVLLQGTGGVSIAALQLAKAAGARVAITSSSRAKLSRARALGADILIDRCETPDWARAAREATGGRGVDLVVDVVGASQTAQCAAALAPDGAIAAIGMLENGGFSWGVNVGVPVNPVTVGNRNDYEAMLRFIAVQAIRPVVDLVYPLESLADALRRLESGAFFGKIGITLQ